MIEIFVGGAFNRRETIEEGVKNVSASMWAYSLNFNTRWFKTEYTGNQSWEYEAQGWVNTDIEDMEKSRVFIFDFTEYNSAGGAYSELGYALRHTRDMDDGLVIVIGYAGAKNIYTQHPRVVHVLSWEHITSVLLAYIVRVLKEALETQFSKPDEIVAQERYYPAYPVLVPTKAPDYNPRYTIHSGSTTGE